MAKFILASQSQRRAELLRQIGLRFEVMASNVDEESVPKAKPASYVKKLAKLKAKAVAKGLGEGIVIGADTIVYLDGKIIGKPKDSQDASLTLSELSGKVHKVITGICIINKYTGKTATKSVATKVKFRDLDQNVINWYVGTGEPLGKAGSYGIQSKGAILVEWVKGDYPNVVGLPLTTLAMMLERMDVKLYLENE